MKSLLVALLTFACLQYSVAQDSIQIQINELNALFDSICSPTMNQSSLQNYYSFSYEGCVLKLNERNEHAWPENYTITYDYAIPVRIIEPDQIKCRCVPAEHYRIDNLNSFGIQLAKVDMGQGISARKRKPIEGVDRYIEFRSVKMGSWSDSLMIPRLERATELIQRLVVSIKAQPICANQMASSVRADPRFEDEFEIAEMEEVAEEDDNPAFVIVEDMPEFSGGEEKMFKYIDKNLVYPADAKSAGIEGTVYVNFIVEKDGSVSGVKVLRGVQSDCNEEAIRLVQSMPKWKPGLQRGKAVRVNYNLPIRFKL